MSNRKKITFPKKVLSYVENSQETDASILNDHLIKSRDKFGSLLHYAAFEHNTAVVQQLIDLGSEVDSVGQNGYTPFMRAVENRCTATFAKIFLKAKASIDIVNDEGISVLQMALGNFDSNSPLVKLFVSKVRTKRTTPEALATRLIAAGCTMFEAATLRDIEVMQCMLEHGIDINSKSPTAERTALYRAAEMNEVDMIEWLVQKGADVNAIDRIKNSVVHVAVRNKNKEILEILLERGADPSCEEPAFRYSALQRILEYHREEETVEEALECVELLLQHGATFDVTPRNILSSSTVFDYALYWPSEEIVKMLMCRLAILKSLSASAHEPVVFCNVESHQSKQPELKEFYRLCLRVLETKMFEDLSLLDLLNASQTRLNSLVRKKMFVSRVKTSSSKQKLSETHAFYYKTLMKRIDKADRVVKLEVKAILVICKLFRCSYNSYIKFYNSAREIVSYLKEYELEKLVQVGSSRRF